MPEPLNDRKIAEFRGKVCEIAARQFAARGMESVSMRSLAKELGYSATALYSYFGNKNEIIAAVQAATIDRLSGQIRGITRSGGEDPWEPLNLLCNAYLEFARREPTAYQLAFSYRHPPGAVYPDLDRARSEFFALASSPLARLIREEMLFGDAPTLAYILWCTLHGVIALTTTHQLKSVKLTQPELLEKALRLFRDGAAIPSEADTAVAGRKANEQYSFDI